MFDASGLIGNGSAHDFSFFVKPPPVASFEAPALVAEGASFTLDGTASTSPALPDGANKLARYQWSMGDGTVIEQKAGDAGFGKLDYRYASHGVYVVTLTVTDSADNPCNTATAARSITVNAPPVANAGGNKDIALGETLTVDAGSDSDADGNAVRFHWDFGDGGKADGAKASHRYSAAGTFKLVLTADDGKGAANSITTDSASIFVNAAPLADAVRIPDRLVVGMPGAFDASQASDTDGKIVKTAWVFGDGTESDKATVRHSYAKPGTYELTLSLTDNSGLANATTTVARKVTVVATSNEAPVADAGGDREADVDAVVSFDGSRSRDADGSILTYQWDFGDGAKAAGIGTRHAYRTAGTYHATLTITDDSGKDNATASTSFDVIVHNKDNKSPDVRVGGDRSAFVNEVVDFEATGTMDSDGSIIAVEWDFGDGARASGFAARHAYGKPGAYKVHVLVTDDSGRRGATSEADFTVTVTPPYNQAPDVEVMAELRCRRRRATLRREHGQGSRRAHHALPLGFRRWLGNRRACRSTMPMQRRERISAS